ncbi:MAG: hypothetical protein HFG44_04355 [Oscillospiraceae bacterium]|jgi:hypothetical protein|nr:hypothetical protein [Oscillospiraceae bacterium]
MTKMKFKTFTWPNNPERYEVEFVRPIEYRKNDAGQEVFAGLGGNCRTMKGFGVFVGSSAYADFKKLEALLYENTAGTLIHPVWQSSKVFFTRLKLVQEPVENYVAYEFTFQEADASGGIPQNNRPYLKL